LLWADEGVVSQMIIIVRNENIEDHALYQLDATGCNAAFSRHCSHAM
jgi:hypothetical protein